MSASIKSRKSSLPGRVVLWLALAVGLHAESVLPCFLADNHAETFGWITRTVDLDQPHTLVLIDAHSDASAAERSEEIREELRRVSSEDERVERVKEWRNRGRVQAFNWIEPLMPRPLARVRWCPAVSMTDAEAAAKAGEAIESLDGRSEVEPRSAGSFASHWDTMDLTNGDWDVSEPVILAVDLDFFAGMAASEREETFERIWQRAMEWPGLRGVAFAVSRPWLVDDAEADALVLMAVSAVSRTRGATLELDGVVDRHPDNSLRAGDLASAGKPVPRWSPAQAPASLRAALGNLGDRLRMTGLPELELLPSLEIRPDDGAMDCDGVWRFAADDAPVLRVSNLAGATGRVRWFALEPGHPACDLIPETGLGKGFSAKPARWVYEARRSLEITEDFALAADRWKPAAGGRVRVQAEIETAAGWLPTAPVEIRLSSAGGFRGALSECFGMPYVFGIAGVEDEDLTGVETGWGSDCANLLVYAWRRQGIPLVWGDPGRLREQLETLAEGVSIGDAPVISAAQIEHGVAVDFGFHMAALWKDRPPLGSLGGNDLVVHHLGGLPEIATLEEVANGRPRYALRVPKSDAGPAVRVAGDVVLAGEELWVIDGFEKASADWFFANLEGVPSMAEPDSVPRFDFRFPKERLAKLQAAGVDAISLANNHAGDAGRNGLLEGLHSLRAAGICTSGAGKNAAAACKPWRSTRNGLEIAFFGVCLTGGLAATADQPGVACLPEHEELLESEMRAARHRGEQIVVLVHGGDEYATAVNADQRRWVRWLVRCGASLVAGAHPHLLQRTEIHAGSVIVHSLGNAVYPATLKGADSGEVRSFRLPPAR